MPTADVLTPQEAAKIATNCYFTLKNWINKDPTADVESLPNVTNRVLGAATVGKQKNPLNTSLSTTKLQGATLSSIHSAQTGLSTTSGFGYTLVYKDNASGKRHVIIATRGTRPELGAADLITDLRAGYTSFGDYGPVHVGFKRTFDSILPNIQRDIGVINNSDVVHCVGHSLGGAVATLIAAHFAQTRGGVKLYSFGSPRVGCFDTHLLLEQKIGAQNIYRVAHDLDPVSLIAPFPYIHVLPGRADRNNMTLPSPTGRLLSTANHDMSEYILSTADYTWDGIRTRASSVDYDNSLLARWLLHDSTDTSWVAYASVQTLSLLFKLFNDALKNIITSVILGLTATDLLAEILLKGLHVTKALGESVYLLLKYAAKWAGITAVKVTDFTFTVIKALLEKMLIALKTLTVNSINQVARNIVPVSLGISGGLVLMGATAF